MLIDWGTAGRGWLGELVGIGVIPPFPPPPAPLLSPAKYKGQPSGSEHLCGDSSFAGVELSGIELCLRNFETPNPGML